MQRGGAVLADAECDVVRHGIPHREAEVKLGNLLAQLFSTALGKLEELQNLAPEGSGTHCLCVVECTGRKAPLLS